MALRLLIHIVMSMDEVLTWLGWVRQVVRGYLASARFHRNQAARIKHDLWTSAEATVSSGNSSESV